MENKFTDSEIMKALECCKSENGYDCEECPCQSVTYKQGDGGCCNAVMGYALDLINRQKAEIEGLQRQLHEGIDLSDTALKVVKSEAIKEFAERLKEIYKSYDPNVGAVYKSALFKAIDNLVKEMEGKDGLY